MSIQNEELAARQSLERIGEKVIAMIDDFIRLLPIAATEKKALRENIQKWEKYRIARQMQEAA